MSGLEADEVARIRPSMFRRLVSVGTIGGLGALLVMLGFMRPPEIFLLRLFVIGLGVLLVMLAAALWQATATAIVLTEAGLYEATGRRIARLTEIRKVERGIFAFKPSNGFVLQLESRQPAVWAPGLWWRIGRRIGVGGTISGAQGRSMADIIGAMVGAARKGGAG